MVGLGCTVHVLEIHELGHVRMKEDVVAAPLPGLAEAERLRQANHLPEPQACGTAKCLLQEFPSLRHPSRVASSMLQFAITYCLMQSPLFSD